MADIACSMARDHLLPFFKEAFSMITGLPVVVADMEDELERIQGLIHTLDAMDADEGNRMKRRMKELIQISFSMEDLIDEYMISMEQQARENSAGCAALCESAVDFIKTMIPRFQLARKMKDINSHFRRIMESSGISDDFQNQSSQKHVVPGSSRGIQNVQRWQTRRSDAPLYMQEGEMVGFEDPKQELIGWLLGERDERTAISIVGMGGQGKTTLAKNVFDNKDVIGSFGCRVWITVSESYDRTELLRVLLQKICKEKRIECPKDISKMGRNSLIEEVRMHLRQERYVVLFDDVWNDLFWEEIEFALIDNKMGSRIIITTRNMNVANSFKSSSFVKIHELKALSFDQCWILFCRKAFKFDCDGKCPEELEEICSKIVQKCGGLPLAVVVIGGLLSRKDKTRVDEWEKFSEKISLNLKDDKDLVDITNILSLSYNALPSHLKLCLLYFGIYPEDYEIEHKRLIRQWLAEGFVKYEEGEIMEEVAEQYLEELINRSLVQASSLSIGGRVRSCRIHDLTREMILKKVKDLSFCHSVHEDLEMNGISRRLTIISSSNDFKNSIESSHIRALFAFTQTRIPEQLLRRIGTKDKCMPLKVLDFQDSILDCVPTNFGNLIQLKYLCLSLGDEFVELPSSIAMLQNLETLDIRIVAVIRMPKEINKLRKLRHLMGNSLTFEGDIGDMTSLETLYRVHITADAEGMKELGRLTRLRKLGLYSYWGEEVSILWSSINKMQNLEGLCIQSWGATTIFGSQFDSPPSTLRKLFLSSVSLELPQWIPDLPKLVKLTLNLVSLKDDPLKFLTDLPHLLFLCLGEYDGESLHFQEGFKKLKKLKLHSMHSLKSLYFGEGSLPSLKFLTLDSIYKLKEVPCSIENLKDLEVLHVKDMSLEFEENLAPIEGPEHSAIRNVPLVHIRKYRMKDRTILHSRR